MCGGGVLSTSLRDELAYSLQDELAAMHAGGRGRDALIPRRRGRSPLLPCRGSSCSSASSPLSGVTMAILDLPAGAAAGRTIPSISPSPRHAIASSHLCAPPLRGSRRISLSPRRRGAKDSDSGELDDAGGELEDDDGGS
jgi:hypothetical protein